MTNGANPNIETDVTYGRGGDLDLKADIYHPTGASKRTAIIQFHGGGFTRGAKESIAANCRAFAERGYTSIATQYRLAPATHWPGQMHDAKAVIRWTRANAQRLDIDPEKIVVAGYSAGATLSLIAAGSNGNVNLEGEGGNSEASSAVAACIAYYPAAVRTRPEGDNGEGLLAAEASDEDYASASTVTYAATAVPTVLFHATSDTTIPFEASMQLFEAHRKGGAPVEMHIFDGLSHVFDRHPEFLTPTVDICDLFIDRHVVEPRVYPPFAPGVARPG